MVPGLRSDGSNTCIQSVYSRSGSPVPAPALPHHAHSRHSQCYLIATLKHRQVWRRGPEARQSGR